MPFWKFRTMKLSEQNRDPIESEFFRMEGAIESIVREAIQNSLDAAAGDGPVVVRFYVSGTEYALSPAESRAWTAGLSPHLVATGIEAHRLLDGTMPFIAIEDFGTRGLWGDPAAASKSELSTGCTSEDFFYFWRNVGITGKIGSERGSWGLGKAVYASSSLVRSVLGWTVRSDDRRSLLMGQSVLNIHEIETNGEVERHDAYGFFGKFATRERDREFAVPAEEPELISKFRRDFRLLRAEDPGLSLVIPFPPEELYGDGCAEKYALEVLHQYTYPILSGQLEVNIITPEKEFSFTQEGLLDALEDVDWSISPYTKDLTEQVILLAMWAINDASRIELVRQDGLAARWSDIEFPEGALAACRELYNRQDFLGFRVPILIRPKDQEPKLSHFDVCLHQDPAIRENAFSFVRQGLTLSEIAGPSGTGVVGLILIEDEAIAGLLRDAENPAHTKWLSRSERLKRNYVGGAERVQFVESAPRILLKRLLDTGGEPDIELLADLFPDPDPEAAHPGPGGGPRRGTRPPTPEPPPPPPRPKPIRLNKVSDGFSVTRVPDVPMPSRKLRVEVAFDCVGANPFKMWEPFDFTFDGNMLTVAATGGVVTEKAGNHLVVEIDSNDFQLEVRGFPATRDVVVRHSWIRGGEAS